RALAAYPDALTARLVHWGQATPHQAFIAQRDAGGQGWRVLRYGEALERVRTIAAALLERGLSAERPVAILSENDIEHALVALACLHVGIPYVPVSPAYSLVSTDHGKLRYAMQLLTPGLVFANDRARYEKAVAAAVPKGTDVFYGESFHTLERN